MVFAALCAGHDEGEAVISSAPKPQPSSFETRSHRRCDRVSKDGPGLMVRDGRFRGLLTMRMKTRIPDHPLTRMSGMTPSALILRGDHIADAIASRRMAARHDESEGKAVIPQRARSRSRGVRNRPRRDASRAGS